MRNLIVGFAWLAPFAAIVLWPHTPAAAIGILALSHVLLLVPTLRANNQWLGPVMTHFETAEREVWLTIDDGPTEDTPALLALLAKTDTRVTFFLKGERATPAALHAIRDGGHTVGNHSYSHPSATFWCLPPSWIAREIDECNAVLGYGVEPRPSDLRAPVEGGGIVGPRPTAATAVEGGSARPLEGIAAEGGGATRLEQFSRAPVEGGGVVGPRPSAAPAAEGGGATRLERGAASQGRFFRAPVGMKNPAVHPLLAQRGMILVGWTARGFDSVRADPDRVAARILPRVEPGAIIVMHQGRPHSLACIERVISDLRGAGYAFVIPGAERLKTKR